MIYGFLALIFLDVRALRLHRVSALHGEAWLRVAAILAIVIDAAIRLCAFVSR